MAGKGVQASRYAIAVVARCLAEDCLPSPPYTATRCCGRGLLQLQTAALGTTSLGSTPGTSGWSKMALGGHCLQCTELHCRVSYGVLSYTVYLEPLWLEVVLQYIHEPRLLHP